MTRHQSLLPDGVLLAAQEVSRARPLDDPQPPAWLRRVLPKSGLAGAGAYAKGDMDDVEEDFDDDDDDLVLDETREPSFLQPISFEVRPGEGLGLAGPDARATQSLVRILIKAVPPTAGRVVARGVIAPLVKRDLTAYTGTKVGWDAVMLTAKFMGWPRPVLKANRREIDAFAALEELEGKHDEERTMRNKTTMRLLYAAMLHMGASVYVLDEGIPSDDEYGHRCFDLLAQRQREGAAVIQRGQRVEEVARFCQTVLWFDKGDVRLKGAPVEVAVEAEKLQRETLHPMSVPVLVSLADSDGKIVLAPQDRILDLSLQVLRKDVELGLTLKLENEHGEIKEIESPKTFSCRKIGHYRLRLSVPGGTLADGEYEATLLGQFVVRGSDPMPPRPLLHFHLASDGLEEAEDELTEQSFELFEDTETEEPTSGSEVEWDVSRTPA
jgi:ABC-type polysaccharide/polyol phosphate transport system ATPase subunit